MRSLECNPIISEPVEYGCSEVEDGINIVWNECWPAPNNVLYLFSCDCSRKCEVGTSSCLDSSLQCADGCHTPECENMLEGFLHRELDALDEGEDDYQISIAETITSVKFLKLAFWNYSYYGISDKLYFTDQNDSIGIKINNT